ncbi:hypothetical protein [Bradyrhizobium sp.]|uniref:hypothetical protein n=1 Tax=Bradyrhizobium sp. TaxID=376 RepID=UPI0025BE2F2C|nr:hypothetical protein [Bradyrhizobium sp.]MBV8916996.1 hypothetical protein [Bradyrhizobium sp.]
MDVTKASADLPGLAVDIVHRQSPDGDFEETSINLRATPSFEAFGQFVQVADPFTLWAQAVRLMWMPWLLTTQTMMLPYRPTRTLPSVGRAQQQAPMANDRG